MAAVISMMNKRSRPVWTGRSGRRRTAEGMLTKTRESKNNRSKAINHLPVKSDHKVLLLKVADIDWVESGHNYVTLRMGRQSYKLRGTLNSIERRLPKDKFVRISRFNIVQIDRIKEFELFPFGHCQVTPHCGSKLNFSRRCRSDFHRRGLL